MAADFGLDRPRRVPKTVDDMINDAHALVEHVQNRFPRRPNDIYFDYEQLTRRMEAALSAYEHFRKTEFIQLNVLFHYHQCVAGIQDRRTDYYVLWLMVYMFPASAMGYDLLGQYYSNRLELDREVEIYERGLQNILVISGSRYGRIRANLRKAIEARESRVKAGLPRALNRAAGSLPSTNEKRRDPLNMLPCDVVQYIFLRLSFPERIRLKQVCKSWDAHIRNTPDLWKVWDFRDCKRPVAYTDILKISQIAQNICFEAYLENILIPDLDKALEVVFNVIGMNPGVLSRLEINICTTIFDEYYYFSQSRKQGLRQLRALKLPLDDSAAFVRLLASLNFPGLEEVFLFGDSPRHVETHALWFDIPGPDDAEFNLLPAMKRLRIGSQKSTTSTQDHRNDFVIGMDFDSPTVSLDPGSTNKLVAMMPNLDSFIYVRVKSRCIGKQDEIFQTRINLRRNENLREVILTQSILINFPILPLNCQTVIIDACDVLPRVVEEDPDGRMRYLAPLPHEDPYDIEDREYKSIEKFDASCAERMTDYDSIYLFGIFDPDKLTDFSIRYWIRKFRMNLSFGDDIWEAPRPWRIDEPGLTPAHYITRMLPWLKRFDVSCTATNDTTLRIFRDLRALEYINLAGCNVTFQGVWFLLTGEWDSRYSNGAFQPPALSRQQWESRLKTIILVKCPKISQEAIAWLENQGISTGRDILDGSLDYLKRWKPEMADW
ncbi:hypothetical protein V1517DRAFT_329987 [Lipomyces orientalis]|uniref:Uncharacterized protein n=1 Tax=Lipomyces orientalis TaxID=1233043 RepID=A0ACC3TGX9_9ASCO